MRGQPFYGGEVFAPVAVDQAAYYLDGSRGDEAGEKLAFHRRLDVEGDNQCRFLADVLPYHGSLVGRRLAEPGILELGRARQVIDVGEDELEAMVVRQVVSGGQSELGAVEVQYVPVPPGALRQFDHAGDRPIDAEP